MQHFYFYFYSTEKNMCRRRFFSTCFFQEIRKFSKLSDRAHIFRVAPSHRDKHRDTQIEQKSQAVQKLWPNYCRTEFFFRPIARKKNMLRSWNSKMVITFERFEIFGHPERSRVEKTWLYLFNRKQIWSRALRSQNFVYMHKISRGSLGPVRVKTSYL